MTKYAKILDSTWWEEDVPVGFKDRSVLDYTVDEENPTETVLKWKEYLTHNNHQWKVVIYAGVDLDIFIGEYAIFSRNGYPISVPKDYANSKISLIDEAEYKTAQNKSGKDYYLLYDYASDRFARDIEEKPLDIDFKRNLIKTLYPSTTENITTYYGDEAQTIKVVEEHDYSSYSEIYWYKISGKDIVPKTYKKSK